MVVMRVLLLFALLTACRGPQGTVVTPEQLQQLPAPSADASDKDLAAQDDFEKRRLDQARRTEDHTQALAALADKRSSADIGAQIEESADGQRLAAAEEAARHAAEDLDHFLHVEQARRLRENDLDLRGSADGMQEVREEMEQLEMMYSESDLGDATAEIVLNRTRRRLQRAEERHTLAVERGAEVGSRELPREQERLQSELRAKTVELENARRALEKGRLARQAAGRDLDKEARALLREAEDIQREREKLARDIARWERQRAP